jgi:hypothetical protein
VPPLALVGFYVVFSAHEGESDGWPRQRAVVPASGASSAVEAASGFVGSVRVLPVRQ